MSAPSSTVSPNARPRVLIAGFGDTGVLTAVRLSRQCDVVAVSTTSHWLSGQELGLRVSAPDTWERDYRIAFSRLRGLDGVVVRHGRLTGLNCAAHTASVELVNGDRTQEPYDVAVIATGVSNGFWRLGVVQRDDDVDAGLASAHQRLTTAGTVAVIGGGASAVSAAVNLARLAQRQHRAARVNLYFPGEQALPQHHRRAWNRVAHHLAAAGVGLYPLHRAVVPDGFGCDEITTGPVEFSTGQPAAAADAVVWAIGRVSPHTEWLPRTLLDEHGFVRVEPTLAVSGADDVFAVGDVAATDPLRTSARNKGFALVAHNVRQHLAGGRLREYEPPRRLWGSVLGPQHNGLEVFFPHGHRLRFPAWTVRAVVRPVIVNTGIYPGVRRR